MEIDKELLLKYMTSVSLLKSVAEYIYEAVDGDMYESEEELKEEVCNLEKRRNNVTKFESEIRNKYLK